MDFGLQTLNGKDSKERKKGVNKIKPGDLDENKEKLWAGEQI